jgi:hypothetical protein
MEVLVHDGMAFGKSGTSWQKHDMLHKPGSRKKEEETWLPQCPLRAWPSDLTSFYWTPPPKVPLFLSSATLGAKPLSLRGTFKIQTIAETCVGTP